MSSISAISDPPPAGRGREASHQTSAAVFRANAYYVLARAFGLPGDMEVTEPQLMRDAFSHAGQALRVASATADAWDDALPERESLGVAYARLFLGPFEVLAPPYATSYLDPNQQLMGEISQQAMRAFEEAGLQMQSGPGEAPDHITHESEFMYYLAYQEASTAETIWYQRQARFWTNHLGWWLPRFAELIVRGDCHPFYTSLGGLLQAFSESETDFFLAGPETSEPQTIS